MDLQAMDRCHRIGQTKPVHVYRLATAQSVEVSHWCSYFESFILQYFSSGLNSNRRSWVNLCYQGRILKRAFSKLKLEHVVIGKGQFQQERAKPNNSELLNVSAAAAASSYFVILPIILILYVDLFAEMK